jgi:hypothetical protein
MANTATAAIRAIFIFMDVIGAVVGGPEIHYYHHHRAYTDNRHCHYYYEDGRRHYYTD